VEPVRRQSRNQKSEVRSQNKKIISEVRIKKLFRAKNAVVENKDSETFEKWSILLNFGHCEE
jgi:hypothetical protein